MCFYSTLNPPGHGLSYFLSAGYKIRFYYPKQSLIFGDALQDCGESPKPEKVGNPNPVHSATVLRRRAVMWHFRANVSFLFFVSNQAQSQASDWPECHLEVTSPPLGSGVRLSSTDSLHLRLQEGEISLKCSAVCTGVQLLFFFFFSWRLTKKCVCKNTHVRVDGALNKNVELSLSKSIFSRMWPHHMHYYSRAWYIARGWNKYPPTGCGRQNIERPVS